MKDTHVIHDKALEDEILKDIHGEPEISFVNEKTLEDIHVVSTISCVDKVMEDTHVDVLHDKALKDQTLEDIYLC